MKNLKVIFMGTPDFSVPVLKYLIENTDVKLVVTQPDKEVGRDKKITYSPVKKVALENNIDVFQPVKIRDEFEIISEINPDIIITAAYGQIIPKQILDIPRLGCINVHGSILPKYRGASPIQMAILNGDEKTGITIMYMDEKMDTGDIILIKEIDIEKDDDTGSLFDKLSKLSVDALAKALPLIKDGINERIKQDDEKATYTKLIKREDEHLDFNDNGENIINKIRALSPYPLANFKINDLEIKVIKASFEKGNTNSIGEIVYSKNAMKITCKDGFINLLEIKPFGKKQMDIKSYLNGSKKEDKYVN